MFDEQSNEPHEGVQGVEALGPDQGGGVRLLGQGSVAQIHAHLGAQAEEARDQVVRLQDSLLVHLKKRKGFIHCNYGLPITFHLLFLIYRELIEDDVLPNFSTELKYRIELLSH